MTRKVDGSASAEDSHLKPANAGTHRLETTHSCTGPPQDERGVLQYRGTSPIIKRTALGPYRRLMPRVLRGSQGGVRFLLSEVPLYSKVGMLGSCYVFVDFWTGKMSELPDWCD